MKKKPTPGTGDPKRQSHPPDDPEQSKRFKEAAEELDADEGGEAFGRVFEAVAAKRKGKGPPSG